MRLCNTLDYGMYHHPAMAVALPGDSSYACIACPSKPHGEMSDRRSLQPANNNQVAYGTANVGLCSWKQIQQA